MTHPLSTVFFGTHTFAATILEGLLSQPLFSIDLVITQPDRPVGRHQEFLPSPVKVLAEKHGLAVNQPETLKTYTLKPSTYDLGIVAQYGLLIPKEILAVPKKGIINVHTSLLPKYRGASPIQTALLNGDTETGVTIMMMEEGLDTGPILLQKSLAIDPDDSYPDLDKKMAVLGTATLLEAVPLYLSNNLLPQPQDESLVTTCRQLTRDDGRVNWQRSNHEIYNQYRALTPWPGIWSTWNKQRLKLLQTYPTQKNVSPGMILVEADRIHIGCGKDSLEITHLQLEGKKAMDAETFLRGYKNFDGQHVE